MPKPKPKAKSKPSIEFEVGQTVTFDNDETEEQGTIVSINEDDGEIDVETSENTFTCKPKELTLVETKSKKKTKETVVEEEEPKEEKLAKKEKSSTRSYGKLFSSKKPADQGAFGFPLGNWEALAVGGECAENDKGVSAFIDFVGVNDADVEGKSQRIYSQLFDTDGEPLDGISFFRKNLIILEIVDEDWEPEGESLDELIEEINQVLKKIKKKLPWVTVQTKKGKGGYTNTYLQGLMENQEEKPELPDGSD